MKHKALGEVTMKIQVILRTPRRLRFCTAISKQPLRTCAAWTKRGETHAVTARRGQRLNLIGALCSSGKLICAKLWRSVTGLLFFAFLMSLVQEAKRSLVVILDNASIHTAKSLGPYWELLKEQGLYFYFLPPYSPELNRIEMLWRKMKYEWLPFKAFKPEELEQAVDEILAGFGDKYMLTFY